MTTESEKNQDRLHEIETMLGNVRDKVTAIETETKFVLLQLERMEKISVSTAEFLPVKLVVYGLAGVIMLTVPAALLTVVLRTTGTTP